MITLQNLIPDFSKKLLLKAAAAASVLFLSVTLSAIPSFAASAYDNLAVANVTSEPLNMRTKPSTAGEIVGKCYRGAGGTVLERKDGWTKVRSGKIEGWMSDKYLLFGTDIEPLAKELGLLSAKITATTLNVRETPSTDSAILKQAAEGDSFPVLSESDGWTKVQLSADTNGYISSKYAFISPVPAAAVDAKEESAALNASGNGTSAAPSYVISATEDEIPLTLTKPEVKDLLEKSGVEPERLEHFDKVYEEAAGENTAILVPAITGTGKFAVKTPDVDIKVNPDRLDLVETKFIGGRRCLVIAVEDNVEVNGMPVKMWEEQKEVQ